MNLSLYVIKLENVENIIEEKKYKLDQFYCEKCNNIVKCSKTDRIKKMPENVVIHLKRFSFDDVKLDNIIDFPEKFIFEKKNYCLYAVINHIGTLNSGHYFKYIKTDKWYEINDNLIKPIDNYVTNKAVILFYG